MPLRHSKTPSAFKQNVRTEIAHGKPQKQAVAIAYSEKRAAEHRHHKYAGGGMESCPECYADGGEVDKSDDKSPGVIDKVEKYLNDLGASTGQQSQQNPMEPQHGPDNAVDSASSARQYDEGGEVDHKKKSQEHSEKAEVAHAKGDWQKSEYHDNMALHHINEGKTPVYEQRAHSTILRKPPTTMSHGGEVEGDESSLHDMATDDLMDALESKDKQRIKECLKTCFITMKHGGEE